MAVVKKSVIKAPTKKKRVSVRTPRHVDEKYTGPEPVWDGSDTWEEAKVKSLWIQGLNYYNYFYKNDEMVRYVLQYGKEQLKWTAEDVAVFNEVEDWRVGMTLGSVCRMLLRGAPLRLETKAFMTKRLAEVFELGRARIEEKKAAAAANKPEVKVTIQDRMREKLHDVIGEVEGWYDNFCYKEVEMTADEMVAWFRENNVPQQFVNQIAEYYTPRMEELEEAKSKKADEQLKEGYRGVDKVAFKRISEFYERLTGALEVYGAVKKAVRKARVKKPPSKEKLVKNVKYCPENTELNIVSVNPVDVIGSTQLWVYNVKTRKFGKYVVAADAGVLGIKGSKILGYDPKKSVVKTLRKPKEQLKSFANSGKIALRTFLEDIKAVEVALNGSLSKDWVLLKAVK